MSDEQNKSGHACLSCGSDDRYENRSFGALPRVTSDTVPFAADGRICVCLQCGLIQKIIDAKWKNEIDAIYRNYKLYELTEGSDQPLFCEDGVTRADKIVEIVSQKIPPSFTGSILDIGCGTGGFLKAFADKFPKACLYGQEIDDKNLHYLERIPNFKNLFTQQTLQPKRTFNVIASIHCFEHIYDYTDYFSGIKTMRGKSGQILIQVPDIEFSPFDIVIADHAAHFSQSTLQHCLNRHLNDFTVGRPIHKELTALAPRTAQGAEPSPPPSREGCIKTLDAHVNYLTHLLGLIDEQGLSEFGVYGTTIAGAWLTAVYGDRIAFYIDDDPLKQGKSFFGKKIISADQAPRHGKILMPFAMPAIRKILNNHPHLQPLAVNCE